jgi:predicted  nucleic acid-binding Zn-ribbon protein
MEYPYKPPAHLQYLADFGNDEVTKTVAGRCPNCGGTRLRYLDEYEEGSPDNIVACDDCRNWAYENELDIADPNSDDEAGDFSDIDESEDHHDGPDGDFDDPNDTPRRSSFLALGATPVEPVAPMDALGPRTEDQEAQVDRTPGVTNQQDQSG